MKKAFHIAVAFSAVLATTGMAMAQQSINPTGLDYGPFFPPVPPQVTTYYAPLHHAMYYHSRRHARRM